MYMVTSTVVMSVFIATLKLVTFIDDGQKACEKNICNFETEMSNNNKVTIHLS